MKQKLHFPETRILLRKTRVYAQRYAQNPAHFVTGAPGNFMVGSLYLICEGEALQETAGGWLSSSEGGDGDAYYFDIPRVWFYIHDTDSEKKQQPPLGKVTVVLIF